jgi:hypothetical protein
MYLFLALSCWLILFLDAATWLYICNMTDIVKQDRTNQLQINQEHCLMVDLGVMCIDSCFPYLGIPDERPHYPSRKVFLAH